MLRLLHRIRQSLLGSGQTRIYILYAIGEIALVVIGILIALQINNWNEWRQDRIQEQQVLSQLLTEFSSNLDQLDQKISLRNAQIQSSLTLLKYRKLTARDVPRDSFDLNLSRLILRPTFDPGLGVTNELINSGKLYLISDTDLRNKISAFPGKLSEVREEEMVIFDNTEERIVPFLTEHYQVGGAMVVFIEDTEFNDRHKLSISSDTLSFEELITRADISNLLYHPDLEDHLTIMITNAFYTNEQSEGVRNEIDAIIGLINEGLK